MWIFELRSALYGGARVQDGNFVSYGEEGSGEWWCRGGSRHDFPFGNTQYWQIFSLTMQSESWKLPLFDALKTSAEMQILRDGEHAIYPLSTCSTFSVPTGQFVGNVMCQRVMASFFIFILGRGDPRCIRCEGKCHHHMRE